MDAGDDSEMPSCSNVNVEDIMMPHVKDSEEEEDDEEEEEGKTSVAVEDSSSTEDSESANIPENESGGDERIVSFHC